MSQMDTMTINGQKTISREELLALKSRMNAKALTRQRIRTGGLLAANIVVAISFCFRFCMRSALLLCRQVSCSQRN